MRLLKTLALSAIALLSISAGAHAGSITADLEDFTNGGGFFGTVILEDTAPNTVSVTLDISPPINAGLTQGDILGVWFDVTDVSKLPTLLAAFNANTLFQNILPAGTIQTAAFSANSVNSVGSSNNNLNGGGGAGSNFDIGIAVGTQGSAGGFNQTITFDMVSIGLDTSLFLDQRIGMRVQSIQGGTFMSGSSKLLGDGTTTSVPEPGTLAVINIGLLILGSALRRLPNALLPNTSYAA